MAFSDRGEVLLPNITIPHRSLISVDVPEGKKSGTSKWFFQGVSKYHKEYMSPTEYLNSLYAGNVDHSPTYDILIKQILIGFGQGEVERAPSHQLCKCQWWWNVSMEGSQWVLLLPNITTTLRDIRLLSITLLSCFPDEKTEMYWCLKNWQLARSVARI